MKKSLLVATAVVGSVLFSGCATILDGTIQQINVTSNKHVDIEIDGKPYTVPGVISLKKENKDLILKVDDDKCKQTILLHKKVSPTFFVNILSGGVFGSTTDYSTGAMWKYDDNVNIVCPQN